MTGHIEGASGLIISKPWRLDDHEQNPDHNLVVDWVDTEQDAGLTTAEASDIIVSVNGKSFTDLDALYAYLAAQPPGARLIIHGLLPFIPEEVPRDRDPVQS